MAAEHQCVIGRATTRPATHGVPFFFHEKRKAGKGRVLAFLFYFDAFLKTHFNH